MELAEATVVDPPAPASEGPTAEPNASRRAGVDRAESAVLVLELRPVGISAEDAQTITLQVTEVLAQQSGLRVVSVQEINEAVELQRELSRLGCADDSCVAELSKAANAGLALSGSIGRVGEELVLSLSLLDVARAEAKGGASRTLNSLGDVWAILPELLAEVFGWAADGAERPRYRLPAGQAVSFAVFDLKGAGLDEQVAGNLTQVLAAELKKIQGASVVSRDDIASLLQLQVEKDRMGCDDMACLAEIGGALGVDKLIVGHAGKLAESYIVSLRLIDVDSSVVESRRTETFDGIEGQLLPAVRHASRQLLGIEDATLGDLALAGSELEAEVFLDNEPVGLLPMPPIAQLAPGRHSVRLVRDGFIDWRSDVYIEPGATTALWGAMLEAPEKWYEKWWVWTIVGVAVAGGVTTAVVVTTQNKAPTTGGFNDGPLNIKGGLAAW